MTNRLDRKRKPLQGPIQRKKETLTDADGVDDRSKKCPSCGETPCKKADPDGQCRK